MTLDVAYVMTDYPRLAMTFIADEIDEVECLGHRVVPIAINVPLASESSERDHDRRERSCLYLKRAGWLPIAAATFRTARRNPVEFTQLVGAALRSARLDLGLTVRRLAHLAYASLVVEHCRAASVRHLHSHFGQAPASIAWFASSIGNWGHDGRWSWSFTIHGFQDFVDENVARLDLKAESADFVVCVSDFTRSQLCRITDPVLWDRFHVVRCGIDFERFPPRSPHSASAPARVLTVGRLSPEKGHATLLEAICRLRDHDGIDVELEIVGDGPFAERLEQLATELGIDTAVTFRGQLPPDEVARHLSRADVFCLPSFSEGLPVSIMEAMAVGVPVVATAIAGIPELAVHRETAVTVPPGSVPELARAIATLLRDRELCDGLVSNASKLVQERHSLHTNVPQLIELFEESEVRRSCSGDDLPPGPV